MSTETSILLAVLAAPLAVLALVAAVATVVLARRLGTRARMTTRQLDTGAGALVAACREARATLDHVGVLLASLHAAGSRLDRDLPGWTASLVDARLTVQRLTRSRLGPLVRTARIAGALARVAFLWRSPVR